LSGVLLGDSVPGEAAGELVVRFEGDGAGEEELSWGQVGFWQGMEQTGQSGTMGAVVEMPPEVTIEQLGDLLRFVIGRHQSLRTRLRFVDGGPPRQVCSASGELRVPIVEAGEQDPAELAEAIQRCFTAENFDYENEWPIRQAIVTKHGVVTHCPTVYLHTAIDAGGLAALLADLFARDPVTGAAAGPVTALQPMEQARRQRTPAVRRHSTASLRHLEHVMRTVTPQGFGPPKYPGEAGFRMINFSSPATALAIPRIVAEHNVNSSSVLLAMVAVGVARHTGNGTVMAMLSNRFRPGLAESVSPLVQISPYLIDVAGVSLAEAVARAGTSLLHTYKNAYYDPYEQDALIDRVNAERGDDFDLCFFYNDRREQRTTDTGVLATDDQIRAAVAASSWEWQQQADMSTRKLFMNVDDPAGSIDFQISVDCRYFDAEDMQSVVCGIEAAAVEAALNPAAPTGVRARVASGDERRIAWPTPGRSRTAVRRNE
jgi:hypothetical protein